MNTPQLTRPLVFCAGIAACAIMSGCASASKPEAMVATTAPLAVRNSASVEVRVSGGAETSALGASNIANEDFAAAIKSSIEQSGLFAKIAAAGGGDYKLEARIVRLDRPTFGLSFTVNLEVDWRLLKSGATEPLWEKAVTSTFTATMGDAFAGVKRLRLANEGAARANITDALTRVASLKLR